MIGIRPSRLSLIPIGMLTVSLLASFLVSQLYPRLTIGNKPCQPVEGRCALPSQSVLNDISVLEEQTYASHTLSWLDEALNYWCVSKQASRGSAAAHMSDDARKTFSTIFWQSEQQQNVVRALVWRPFKCNVRRLSPSLVNIEASGTLVAYQSSDAIKNVSFSFDGRLVDGKFCIEKFQTATPGVKKFVDSACAGDGESISKDAILNYEEARAQWVAGNYVGALNAYNLALRRSPGFSLALYARGLIFGELAESDPVHCKRYYEFALADHERALARNSALFVAQRNRARCLYLLERHTQALAAYEQLCRQFPDSSDLLTWRGTTRYITGNVNAGIEDLERAIELEPTSCSAHLNLGWALKSVDPARARTLLLYSITLCPSYMAYEYLADLDMDRENFADAARYLSHAISLEHRKARLYLQRAQCYGCLGDFHCSLSDLDTSIRLEPTPEALYLRGITRRHELNDLEGGIVDVNRAIELSPKNIRFWHTLGLMLRQESKQRESASYVLKIAAQLPANSWREYSERAQVREDLRDFRGAVKDLDDALIFASVLKDRHAMRFLGSAFERRSWLRLLTGDWRGFCDDFSTSIVSRCLSPQRK